ncbi:hypothetical protein STRCI_008673 [Streptomyces cinnabarinus]|uniref:Uncharacterized protein n=1 Tax=Streptomyces cinnabarinus TaxID=67287 RepID=A0ABY7K3D1_9ACTN|nr:hypothetical protein [Streptomyces cinnabarinus]WAZ18991.1 hypothetical protein STRCI_000002 [Streptomyces cinnabarinus]WAZ26977.1 hypothetical protein STRCI_008673 [Streptomyces cinnabarinus]
MNSPEKQEENTKMAKLKPVSIAAFAEAREEAHVVLAHLMARLAPGEHVVRLGVGMEGQDQVLSATLPITVQGEGSAEDLVGVEPKFFDNFVFLLACGLAQTLSYGVMYLRSPSPVAAGGPSYTVQAWDLDWGTLTECDAARAQELIGEREPALFTDAFGVHCLADDEDGDGAESVYPPVAYTVL